MIQNEAHGSPTLGGEHTAMNGIFVHLLYAPMQHHGGGPGTSPTGSVYILRRTVAPYYSLGVQLGTTLMSMHHSVVNNLPPLELLFSRFVEL